MHPYCRYIRRPDIDMPKLLNSKKFHLLCGYPSTRLKALLNHEHMLVKHHQIFPAEIQQYPSKNARHFEIFSLANTKHCSLFINTFSPFRTEYCRSLPGRANLSSTRSLVLPASAIQSSKRKCL
jgi:hypothetical protein